MGWKKVVKKITDVAPLVGTVLGGPIGGVSGTVLKAIGNLVGAKKLDPKTILGSLTPDNLNKIAEFEKKYEVELQKIALEKEKARYADIANARTRERDIVKTTGKKDINLYLLAWSVILGFFALCGILMRWPLPEGSSQVVFMLFGALSTGFGTVLQYFFGSSSSSSDKNLLLLSMSKKQEEKEDFKKPIERGRM